MSDPQALARLLSRRSAAAVEHGGATALFELLAGREAGPVTADIRLRRGRALTRTERRRLHAPAGTSGHERLGTLRTSTGIAVAQISAVILPGRLPPATRTALGIAVSGAPLPTGSGEPLGRALRGLGVTREPLQVRLTPGARDAAGTEQVLYSAARLWLDTPVALVTERVYLSFLETLPGRPQGTAP
jgi:hypothetical protein